jgi:hypothetical protein
MTAIRVARRARFTAVARDAVNDDRLSFRARGVLVWLLDKPDDWSIDSTKMSHAAKEGREAIRTALRELEQFGYLQRSRVHDDITGLWRQEVVVHEQPCADSEPETGFRAPVNRAPVSWALSLKTVTEDCYIKDKDQTPSSTDVDKSDPLIGFDHFWNAYPQRNGKRLGRGICEGKWSKMNLDERRAAYHGAVHYAAACEAGLQGAMDPERFLAHRRWVDWQTPAVPGPGLAGPRRSTQMDVLRQVAADDPRLAAAVQPQPEPYPESIHVRSK